ncbi:unnamed protein product [Cochlearia groenlandica]
MDLPQQSLKIQHQIITLNSGPPPPQPLQKSTIKELDSPPRASTINEPMKKLVTPDRLKVPLAFKHPERYRSPTDAMMSPITKGLLARTRKPSTSLIPPPTFNHTKPSFCYEYINSFSSSTTDLVLLLISDTFTHIPASAYTFDKSVYADESCGSNLNRAPVASSAVSTLFLCIVHTPNNVLHITSSA